MNKKIPFSDPEAIRIAIAIGIIAIAAQINFNQVKYFGDDLVTLSLLFVLVAFGFAAYLGLTAFRYAPGSGFFAEYTRNLGNNADNFYTFTAFLGFYFMVVAFASLITTMFAPFFWQLSIPFDKQAAAVLLSLIILVVPAYEVYRNRKR
ncbi:MAG: hypothetical protein IPJ89_05035 [Candidatus Iainarchaeum archaeon]|uniref:Uncharacterized protein n=1 Tax=Candidatus Iainarchaeum sp. TaxID=3101447 RepID=A0A7T9I1M0_9ARCH|nr:MAG: hypothetical protein IPJ89_05035 [Candidatus Diapherotrites archaeon]